jgi:hypothetical protein
MNIINKFFLKLALLPKKLYANSGVNISQLTSILFTKLMMDDRRPNTFQQTQRRKKEKNVTLATLGTMAFSAILGLMFLMAFTFGDNVVTQLTLYFSLFIFMLASTLITDFTSVLIDVRDNYIILPKPVNDRTVVVARLLHILIHICKVIFPMVLPGFIFIIINYNAVASLPFVFMVLLATLFAIFVINAAYILILRITTPQKFTSIISYIQIGFAVIIYGSYQLLPEIMKNVDVNIIDLSHNYLMLLAPSYWFAAGWNVLRTLHGTLVEWLGFAGSIILPLLCIYVVVKYLAPTFNQKLSMISGSEAAEPGPGDKKMIQKTNRLASPYVMQLAKLFTNKGSEKMGFLFAWKMMSRSRDFKLKVYPSIGYLIVYYVVMSVRSKNLSRGLMQTEEKGARVLIIFAMYFLSLLLITAISQMIYSEKFKAAWVYFITPVKTPGIIIIGAVKAVILKFYIPLVLIATTAGLFFFGVHFLPNLILGLFNVLFIASFMVYVGFREFPFSRPQSNAAKAGSFVRNLFIFIIVAILGFLHFFIYQIFWVVVICAILSIIATWLVMDAVKRTEWQKIKTQYE